MASGLQGEIGAITLRALANYVYPNNSGNLFIAGTTFTAIEEELTEARIAVSFVASENLPEPLDEDIPFAPDLAVDIIGPSDTWYEVVQRARNYLQAGTKLVWVIDPYTLNILVFSSGKPMQTLNVEDELDGEDVVPGFKLPIKNLFRKSRSKMLGVS